MKRYLFFFFLPFFIYTTCTTEPKQSVRQIPLEELQSIIRSINSPTVVYFWATWCVPCIQELPNLKYVMEKFPEVNFIMVLLDEPDEINKAKEILKEKKISHENLLLNLLEYPDMDSWIDSLDPNWSGALPHSIFIDSGKKKQSHTGYLSKDDFQKYINKIIMKK